MNAAVPYSLLRTLRACLDGTADQPAWDRAKDELDVELARQMTARERIEALPEVCPFPGQESMVRRTDVLALALLSPACSLCEAGHVPLTPCDPSSMAEWDEPLRKLAETQREYLSKRPGPEGDGDPC